MRNKLTPTMRLLKQARERGWPMLIAARYAGLSRLPGNSRMLKGRKLGERRDMRDIASIPLDEYLPEAKAMNDAFVRSRVMGFSQTPVAV